MIYIPGQPPELQTTTPELIRWVQTELERVSALSRIQEEDIAEAATTGSGATVRWDLDECYSTTGAMLAVWDIDELNAVVAYTTGTMRFEEGAA
jgi:hypothetical protein